MEIQLKEALSRWSSQIDKLRDVEEKYFSLEASEKAFFHTLFAKATGKTIMDRECEVYRSSEWKRFSEGLALSRAEFNYEKRVLEIKIKAFDAAYLGAKQEFEMERKISS